MKKYKTQQKEQIKTVTNKEIRNVKCKNILM